MVGLNCCKDSRTGQIATNCAALSAFQAQGRARVYEIPLPHFAADLCALVAPRLTLATFHLASRLPPHVLERGLSVHAALQAVALALKDPVVAKFGMFRAAAMELMPLCVKYNLCAAVREILCGQHSQADPEFAYQMRTVLIDLDTKTQPASSADLSALHACLPVTYAATNGLRNMVLTLLECSSPVTVVVPIPNPSTSGWAQLRSVGSLGTRRDGALPGSETRTDPNPFPLSPPALRALLHPSVLRAGLPLRSILDDFLRKLQKGVIRGEAVLAARASRNQPHWARRRFVSDCRRRMRIGYALEQGEESVIPGQPRDAYLIPPVEEETKAESKADVPKKARVRSPVRRWGSRAVNTLALQSDEPSDELSDENSPSNAVSVDDVTDSRANSREAEPLAQRVTMHPSPDSTHRSMIESVAQILGPEFAELGENYHPERCVTDVLETCLTEVDFVLALAENVRVRWTNSQIKDLLDISIRSYAVGDVFAGRWLVQIAGGFEVFDGPEDMAGAGVYCFRDRVRAAQQRCSSSFPTANGVAAAAADLRLFDATISPTSVWLRFENGDLKCSGPILSTLSRFKLLRKWLCNQHATRNWGLVNEDQLKASDEAALRSPQFSRDDTAEADRRNALTEDERRRLDLLKQLHNYAAAVPPAMRHRTLDLPVGKYATFVSDGAIGSEANP